MRKTLMLLTLISLMIFIQACTAKTGYTVFVKEDSRRFYNLHGEDCLESGYSLDQGGTRLITYYENCDFHSERLLKEFEIKQWQDPARIQGHPK